MYGDSAHQFAVKQFDIPTWRSYLSISLFFCMGRGYCMAADKLKWISIMIVPEDGAGVKNWRISTRRYAKLKAGLWVVLFLLLAGFASSVALVYTIFQVNKYQSANEELIEATSKVEIIAGRLAEYERQERKIREILGEDLSLPAPMTVERYGRSRTAAREGGTVSFDELDDAVSREVSRLRRIPNIWPVDVWQITKEFAYSGNPRSDHLGIDILSWGKSLVVATADGKVTFANPSRALGLKLIIDHENGWVTEYGHNQVLYVKYGDKVKKGQTIAVFGGVDDSGSGPHLHYGMYYNKKPVDPLIYIKPKLTVAKKND